jgi:hypothetical protein
MKLSTLAVIAAAAALTISACGSSSSSSSSTSIQALSAGTTTPNAVKLLPARLAAVRCIRAHGINVPDPGTTRQSVLKMAEALASVPPVKVQAATKACAAQIKLAFPNLAALTPAQRELRVQEVDAFAACMRQHGINFPDPSSAAANSSASLQQIQADSNSPAFKAATPTCKTVMLKDTGQ